MKTARDTLVKLLKDNQRLILDKVESDLYQAHVLGFGVEATDVIQQALEDNIIEYDTKTKEIYLKWE